jgi:ectoine hydroxylase-related dioxygenase (phytanoyl-CoA dioxygenase family)
VIVNESLEDNMAVSAPPITSEHARQFREEGFFVLRGIVAAGDLDTLRGECQRVIDAREREMDRLGVDKLDLDHRGRRYFLHAYGESPAVERFLSSDLMAQVAQAALGDTVYLFNEQYVVKAAERGMQFSWHQDSGFIDYAHRPYLTCWIALDDMTEANGTVYLLPYSRAGTRGVMKHARDKKSNDLVGMRRVYVAQYSAEPILSEDGSQLRVLAEPLLVHGKRVS